MMQPTNGAVPPPMPPMPMNQQQQPQHPYYQQHPQPPQQQQFHPQHPPVWGQQPPQGWAVAPPQQHQAMQTQMQPQVQPQQQQYGASPTTPGSDEIRSLWIGDLQYWMDENYLNNIFYATGELLTAKIIRNKQTGQSEGYGFLEFRTRAAAETTLHTYNGTLMPNTEQNFRMNWATLGAGEKRSDDSPDYTIFVGDLAADVNDYLLQETFKAVYSSVKGAKVVADRETGRSKGYGFVRFADESEQLRAMAEMNGVLCSSRAMRIGPAANKKPMGGVGGSQKGTARLSFWGPGNGFS